jgi:hypothetical protein
MSDRLISRGVTAPASRAAPRLAIALLRPVYRNTKGGASQIIYTDEGSSALPKAVAPEPP